RASPSASATPPAAAPVKEIDVDLSPSGLEDVSMTMRLAGDRLSVVIRAASSQTAGSIEGARDAIADRLAAIGQPLDSLIVRQTGVNADASTNGNAGSADEGSTGGGRQSGQDAGEQGSSGDASSPRRGAARDRSF
ncbi:MAG TPA: flagellar hook-length control protein FliK, partial [Roseiarcus sp.]